jgi:hypothetical protein
MFLYAQIYWLAKFGDVSCLQFNYLRVETLTPTWEDLVGHLSDNFKSEVRQNSVVRPECLIVDTLGGICSQHIGKPNDLKVFGSKQMSEQQDFQI